MEQKHETRGSMQTRPQEEDPEEKKWRKEKDELDRFRQNSSQRF